MDIVSLVYVFILGALVGSFIHVVALRYNTGVSFLTGRSICFSCGKTLKWYELFPIASFLFLRGKCSSCKTHIPWRYPAVEAVMGAIFVGIALVEYSFPLYMMYPQGLLLSSLAFVYYAIIFCILMIIVIYDIRHTIIPNVFVYTFIALALAKLAVVTYLHGLPFDLMTTLDVLAPFILSIPFALLWFVSGGKWIGFGDAKMAFGIGALLGFVAGISAIIVAFWIGALYGIGIMLYTRAMKSLKKVSMSSEVPFAPFLALAVLIVFLTHLDVLNLHDFFNLL